MVPAWKVRLLFLPRKRWDFESLSFRVFSKKADQNPDRRPSFFCRNLSQNFGPFLRQCVSAAWGDVLSRYFLFLLHSN